MRKKLFILSEEIIDFLDTIRVYPIIQKKSDINYSYDTIKIKVLLDNSDDMKIKNCSSFSSPTKESRIGGLREWIDKNKSFYIKIGT